MEDVLTWNGFTVGNDNALKAIEYVARLLTPGLKPPILTLPSYDEQQEPKPVPNLSQIFKLICVAFQFTIAPSFH